MTGNSNSSLKTYRAVWQLTPGAPEVYKTFGLSNDDALYTCVRALTGLYVSQLHMFEAHCMETDGNVRVIHGDSPTPKGDGTDVKIIPKQATLEALSEPETWLSSVPTVPYELWSVPNFKGETRMLSSGVS